MSLENDLRTYLCSKSTITAIIGTNPKRVYATVLPEKAVLPAITYATVSANHGHLLLYGAGYCLSRIQINCWSDVDQKTTLTLSEAVRQVLQGFDGTMGTTAVQSVVLKNEQDLYEPPVDGKALGTFCRAVDYMFRFTESVPNL
jgi:hypothetical protein